MERTDPYTEGTTDENVNLQLVDFGLLNKVHGLRYTWVMVV